MDTLNTLFTIFNAVWVLTNSALAVPVDNTAGDVSYLGNRIFTQPDLATGQKLDSWSESSPENPEELGEYAEGDIVFPSRSRNGLVGSTFRWPKGVVPYEVAGSYSTKELELIDRALGIYKKYTCITFRRKTASDRDYISITNGRSGCWSSVGRIGGRQEVNLQNPSCTTKVGTVLHELMHALGFLHEQSRYERDDYITVLWNNIKKGHEGNFKLADKGSTEAFGISYDYRSVMHYSSRAFSANGDPTLVPKDKRFMEKIGQREGFSKGDITKINAMYNCPQKTSEIINGTGPFQNSTETGSNLANEKPNSLFNLATDLFSLFIH